MLDRRADRTRAAERMADQVGFRNLEMVQQRGDVVAHRGEAHRPVRVRGAAVAGALHRKCRVWDAPRFMALDSWTNGDVWHRNRRRNQGIRKEGCYNRAALATPQGGLP